MSVGIRNICPDFLAFWEQAQDCSLAEQKRLWKTLYEERHRDIFDIYYPHYGDPTRLETALGMFPRIISRLRRIAQDTERRIERVVLRCIQLFNVPDSNLDFVLMVGLFSSNGWTTELHGKPTSFLALEFFPEPQYLDIVIAHETAHSLHGQCRAGKWTDAAIGKRLFEEGLATLASKIVCSPASDADCLLFRPDQEAECEGRWSELRQRFLKDLERIDEHLTAIYFWGDAQKSELPIRVGYFVGYRAVVSLYQRHTIAEMARWSPDRAVAGVKQVLEPMNDK